MDIRTALNRLLAAPEFQALEDRLRNRSAFHILGIHKRELSHSAFLAWLLDPRGSHGMGSAPLRRFMLMAALRSSAANMVDAVDIDALDLDSMTVTAEEVIDGKRRLDVVVWDVSDFPAMVVEYKVDAEEGEDQTRTYAAWADENRFDPSGRNVLPLLVYLCPDRNGASKPAEPFAYVSYGPYIAWLDAIRAHAGNDLARMLIAEFRKCLAQREVDETPEKERELATLKLKADHADAINVLVNADRDELAVHEALVRRHAAMFTALDVSVGKRKSLGGSPFVAEAREVAKTMKPERWSTSGGGSGSWTATLEASVVADAALREEGLLGSEYPLRIRAFLSRPTKGAARLALAIRGATDVPGLDESQAAELRDTVAADLRSRLASGPLKGALGTQATIAALKITTPGVQSIEDDTPGAARAARPALEEALGKLTAVEAVLEEWCRDRLPEMLRDAARPS